MGQSVANGCYSSSGWRVPDFALEGAVQDLETPIEEVIQLAEDRAYGEPGAMDVFFDQNGNLL
jgi:hypothetical protein